MAATKYTKSIVGDFPNSKFDLGALEEEIRGSAIITALDFISGGVTGPDNCDVWFKDALSPGDEAIFDALVAAHTGDPLKVIEALDLYTGGNPVPQTDDHVIRVSAEPIEKGTMKTFISPNWSDRCTWYYDSIKHTAMPLVDSGDGLTFDGTNFPWVDNYHGRYSDENFLLTKDGELPRLQVYINGAPAVEQNPHFAAGGDYTVDYATGKVTFLASQAGKVITVDVWETGTSLWVVAPEPGKMLKIVGAETQFSNDMSLRDTVSFAAWVYNPFDLPNKVPYGDPKLYKTKRDYIDDSNSSNPVIKKTVHPNPSWRDLAEDVQVFPWDYAAIKPLRSSLGAEIRISLLHETPFDGGFATATIYCLSFDE